MSNTILFQLDSISVVDVLGADAVKIVHNLTTNDVKKLSVGEACESFVTDVRGKTLGHVTVLRMEDRFRLFGADGQSHAVHDHIDKYTISEDATPIIRDQDFTAMVAAPDCDLSFGNAVPGQWLGEGSRLVLAEGADELSQLLAQQGVQAGLGDMASFHDARVRAGYPWFGIDLTDKNLPQEADREPQTISFTKGCYLGQETVARLDALGQVQKKLMRWSISGGVPCVGMELRVGEKTVGRLTSVLATSDSSAMAIGMTRRSHFESGVTAQVYSVGDESKLVGEAVTL